MYKLLFFMCILSTSSQVLASSFLSINGVGNRTVNAALNGRALFEAYPNAEINGPSMLNFNQIEKDRIFLQSYPPILTREEILLIHREILCKENRFMDLLGLSYGQFPKTKALMQLIMQKVYEPILYLKLHFNRPRPFALVPSAVLPIDKPSSPSYPSGDATEGYLIAMILSDFFENQEIKQALKDLANEIAHHRELAGVCYPSDTEAGKQLAANMKPILLGDKYIQKAIKSAKNELKSKKQNMNIKESINLVLKDKRSEELLAFNKTPLKEFIAKIQMLTETRIKLQIEGSYFVTTQFKAEEWPVYLDLVLWKEGLRCKQSATEIIIYEGCNR